MVRSAMRENGWPVAIGLRSHFRSSLLVIHGDLPLVMPDDINALIAAADEQGCALAPDRHGAGTNAAAIGQNETFAFTFGKRSLAKRLASAPSAAIVQTPGLSIDIDTQQDFEAALAAGLTLKDFPTAWPARSTNS